MERLTLIKILMLLMFFNNSAMAETSAGSASEATLPVPSSRAQTLYKSVSKDLLQIRILLKNGRTQSSVGSGFLIGNSELVVTNYHVVSQLVLYPNNYVGEYIDTNGERGSIKLLAVDALHDLAVVSVNKQGAGSFQIVDVPPALTQGQYLYSLGNPLDLGFAISEGAYNGVIRRGFYDQLMFTGPINSGMSGGPNLTENGRVAGVNVSKRLDGELVSFLVPVKYVRDLVKKANVQLTKKDALSDKVFKQSVGEQLLAHQNAMVDNLLAEPLALKTLGIYQVPVRESDQMRCWGNANDHQDKSYDYSSVDCTMESAIFVSNQLQVGHIAIRHEYAKATEMGRLQFAAFQTSSFQKERFGSDKDVNRTAPQCTEAFVKNKQLPMRAVLCVSAYRDFKDLYDFSVLTAATDKSLIALHSRLDASGVSYENGLRLTHIFLNNLGYAPLKQTQSKAVRP